MIRVCLHGAESTGKSTLADRLADRFGCPVVPEYGRTYAETHGTAFTLADLLAIAREQDRLMHEAVARAPRLLLLDTDPLMTAAWAEKLFGTVPDELLAYDKAELYLLFSPEVPWVADGTRLFGEVDTRTRFAELAEAVLVRAGVHYRKIGGDWAERERQARIAIEALR
ncbi:MAG TPA: ATP-binding protein [Croceibacterium sp.]|nr:ATP-binding protein [Croceibacterium sp.]